MSTLRRLSGVAAAGVLAVATSAFVRGADPVPARVLLPAPVEELIPSQEPTPQTTGALRLTLPEAVRRGMLHNKALAVRKLDPSIASSQALTEKGVFDFVVNLDARAEGIETPTGSQLEGAAVSDTESQSAVIGVQKKFETGTLLSTRLLNRRFGSNSVFQLVNPQYTSNLVFDIVQPLARDAGRRVNRAALDIAIEGIEQGRQRFRKVTLDTVSAVEQQYWELAFALRDRAVRYSTRNAALALAEHDSKRLKEGIGTEADVIEALTAAANRAGDSAGADRQVADAEEILRRLLGLTDRTAGPAIEPADPLPTPPAAPRLERALAVAFEKRPDYREAMIELKRRDIRVAFLKNQLRPRIDLIATYGQNGLSSSFGRSLDQVFEGDFQTYTVGVQVELPVQNRAAKGAHREGELLLQQAILALQALEDQIEEEVRRALRAVETDGQKLAVARDGEELSVRQMKFAAQRFQEGLLSNIDLLRFQQDVALARSRRLRASADLLKSHVALEAATGNLLDARGIRIDPLR